MPTVGVRSPILVTQPRVSPKSKSVSIGVSMTTHWTFPPFDNKNLFREGTIAPSRTSAKLQQSNCSSRLRLSIFMPMPSFPDPPVDRTDFCGATGAPAAMARNDGGQIVDLQFTPTSQALTGKYRRNGKLQSCEPCRKSKLKCDHVVPACGRCVKRGRVSQCVYHPNPLSRVSLLFLFPPP